MPAPDNTPAPARRFLPLPSSSSAKSSVAASARKNALHFSRAKAFTSSASHLPCSQRFETPAKTREDEIQTSFEGSSSSPTLPTRQVFTSFGALRRDPIDESETIESHERGRHLRPPNSALRDEILSDKEAALDLRPDSESHAEPYTPMPKRRRISRQGDVSREPILVSSSPSGVEPLYSDATDGQHETPQDDMIGINEDEETEFLPDPIGHQASSRFRVHTTTRMADDLSHLRPTFKSLGRGIPQDLNISALPEAFSPSRRRGKIDYVSGGLADTVRNWILSAATEESQVGTRKEETVEVEHVVEDESGRAVMVVGTDGQPWLLVGKGSSVFSNASSSTVRVGSKATIRGTATQWILPGESSNHVHNVRVATHWDIQS